MFTLVLRQLRGGDLTFKHNFSITLHLKLLHQKIFNSPFLDLQLFFSSSSSLPLSIFNASLQFYSPVFLIFNDFLRMFILLSCIFNASLLLFILLLLLFNDFYASSTLLLITFNAILQINSPVCDFFNAISIKFNPVLTNYILI